MFIGASGRISIPAGHSQSLVRGLPSCLGVISMRARVSLFAKILTFDFAQEICHSNVWTNKLPRISEFSYFIFLWKIHIENGSAPYISEKKKSLDYRVHCIQIDRLGLTVSTQKTILKNMHRGQRKRPKCVKFCWFGLEGQFLTLFWWYLGTRCIFFKTDFSIETVSLSRSIWIPWTLQYE